MTSSILAPVASSHAGPNFAIGPLMTGPVCEVTTTVWPS